MSSTRPGPRAPPRRRAAESRKSPTRAASPASYDGKHDAASGKRKVCQCDEFLESNLRQDNGQVICIACGVVISDDVVVNDVTFREAPSGAVHVHGTTIHEGQRFAKSAGTSYRHAGRTPEDAQESSLRNAKEEMTRLANSLSITNIVDRAFRLYTIARVHHFHRPILDSVAICLYIVCRQTKGNTVLLIDFAEKIQQNVFDLGSVYKKFVRAIGLEDSLEEIPIIDIEPLLYRLAKRLEFGVYTRQVANDAALILSRMERDWMVTGRQPPALCGAALVLAARMNNFRRSVREVVYVVKAGDATIQRRLREFRRTRAGQLTVSNFRQYASRLKGSMDPPSVYEARELAERKAKEKELASSQASTPRVDTDGFAVPEIPSRPSSGRATKRRAGQVDESSEPLSPEQSSPGATPPVKKRFRLEEKHTPIFLTPDDLMAEDELEREINAVVASHVMTDEAYDTSVARSQATAEAEKARHQTRAVSDSIIIAEDEFDDDPEVANCLLTDAEIRIKERIWVTANEDWLRSQQERALAKAMEEALGKKKKKLRKQSRQSSVAHDTPASTPAEASARLLEKRAMRPAFSRHINYEKLKKIYRLNDDDDENKEAASREQSVAPSNADQVEKTDENEKIDEEEEEEEEEEDVEDDESAVAGAGFEEEYEDDFDDQADENIDYNELGINEEEEEDFY